MDNQFKVGDVLVGLECNPYTITREGSTVEVISLRNEREICVKVIKSTHPRYLNNTEEYDVATCYFALLKPKRKIQEWV